MNRSEKKKTYVITGIFLLVSLIVFAVLVFWTQHRDLQETFSQAQETVSFLEAECEKFDNYNQGNSARAMQDILDSAIGLKTFVPAQKIQDCDFLKEYIHAEHVSGVLVLDASFSRIAQADMDDKDSYSIWKDTLKKSGIQNITEYPEKTYVDQTVIDDIPYDFAIVSSADGKRIFVCYSSGLKPSTDPYEYTINNVLEKNSFYKNPIAMIADETQIYSSNDETWKNIGKEKYAWLNSEVEWKDHGFSVFSYENKKMYGLRRVYGDYLVYVLYPEKEVFADRRNLIAGGFMLYLVCCMVILLIRWYSDKNNLHKLEKQLRIIDSISTTYDSTFLVHMDKKEIEPLKPSDRLSVIFKEHPQTEDFLFTVCANEVDPVYRLVTKKFLEPDTIGERLNGHPYLEMEVKDINDAWYSVIEIPQRYDANGKLQEVIVTTKDVTTIKHAEELSFKDKLTGLYNRNYMESKYKEIVSGKNYPVSVIMADCNYLKRTNDTLGHEYGDLLLQRVAISIKETVPQNCTPIRVGGDEFVILCAKYSGEQAQELIEKIRQKLVQNSDDILQISVSFGVQTIEDDGLSFEQAYQLADQKMYKDKVASKANRT